MVAIGETLDQIVERALALHGPIDETHRQRPVAWQQVSGLSGERAVGDRGRDGPALMGDRPDLRDVGERLRRTQDRDAVARIVCKCGASSSRETTETSPTVNPF